MRVLFCFLLVGSLFAGEFRLQERLTRAQVGDYIVTEANQMVTLIAIRSQLSQSIILEEISVPLQHIKQRPASWAEWVKEGAKGHTSWSMIEMDLASGAILECYSFSKGAWIQLTSKESLLATLLHLPLKAIAQSERRKIGPPPMPGEIDIRKVWNPPLVYEGKKRDPVSFDVFQAHWPQDGSELAGQELTLYFDRDLFFPLPFWIQLQTSHATVALKTIDSGKNLPMFYKNMPRRIPEFTGPTIQNKQGLSLPIKSPKYYQQFELFAIDVTNQERMIYPIQHTFLAGQGESATLHIAQADLEQTLEKNHHYTWLLVPAGHSESYTQTLKPFVWNHAKN